MIFPRLLYETDPGGGTGDPVGDPFVAEPATTGTPEPAPAAPAAPAQAPSLPPEVMQRLEAQEAYLGQLGQMLQSQQAPQQQNQLPEWDPYDPQIVQTYQQAWQQEQLGPMLAQLQQAAQIVAAQQGEKIAEQSIEQFKQTLGADVPEWVKKEIGGDRDVLLQLGAPFLNQTDQFGRQAHSPDDVFKHVGGWLANRYQAIGEAAVQAFKDSLAGATGAVAQPSPNGGNVSPAQATQARPGESPYAAAMRAKWSQMNPTSI